MSESGLTVKAACRSDGKKAQPMSDAAREVRYEHAAPPPPGEALEVAEGVLWLRMPLPFALDHVNLYVLDDGDGWTVIDCGLNKDSVKALWEQALAGPLGAKPVRRVLVTHFHPDHMGLCRWLVDRFDAELWMSLGEWLWSHFAFHSREQNMETNLEFWRRNGMDTDTVDAMRGRGNFYGQNVGRPPAVYRRISDGEVIPIGGRRWRVIMGQGHAPEHVCLACPEDGLLLSGDQILPRITTNISVSYTEPSANPLALFLDSANRFRHLPRETLVLCAHDRPFRNLHFRLDQLRHHHEQRCAGAVEALADGPKTAVELMPTLFHRPLDLHQQSFAIGEAIAHMHHLMYMGRVRREADAAGVLRFARA